MTLRFQLVSPAAVPALAGGHEKPVLDVQGNFQWIEIDEMANLVVRDAPQFGPFSKRTDRGLLPLGEDAAHAQAFNVGQPGLDW